MPTTTKPSAEHTALPWSVDYSGPARLAITSPDGTTLAFMNLQCEDGDVDEANAALICKAVNSHAELVRLADLVADTMSELYAAPDALQELAERNPEVRAWLSHERGSMLARESMARAILSKLEKQ